MNMQDNNKPITQDEDYGDAVRSTPLDGHAHPVKIEGEKDECTHEPLEDIGNGFYHCPGCKKYWTYEEWEDKRLPTSREGKRQLTLNEFAKKCWPLIYDHYRRQQENPNPDWEVRQSAVELYELAKVAMASHPPQPGRGEMVYSETDLWKIFRLIAEAGLTTTPCTYDWDYSRRDKVKEILSNYKPLTNEQ